MSQTSFDGCPGEGVAEARRGAAEDPNRPPPDKSPTLGNSCRTDDDCVGYREICLEQDEVGCMGIKQKRCEYVCTQ